MPLVKIAHYTGPAAGFAFGIARQGPREAGGLQQPVYHRAPEFGALADPGPAAGDLMSDNRITQRDLSDPFVFLTPLRSGNLKPFALITRL